MTNDSRRTTHDFPSSICYSSYAVSCSIKFLRFGMIKKRYTFATEIGPIVQWISTFVKASADKGMVIS